jgi:hypothetical protein
VQPIETRSGLTNNRLNNWMMVHPQVGPGADVTMTPFGVFPPQLQPYAQPFDQTHDPYATLSLGHQHQQYAPQNKAPQWAADNIHGEDRNVPSNGLGLGSLVDAGLGSQIGGQTQLYWDNLIDGEFWCDRRNRADSRYRHRSIRPGGRVLEYIFRRETVYILRVTYCQLHISPLFFVESVTTCLYT